MKKRTIEENLKHYFFSGVSLAAHAGEVIQKSSNELARQNRGIEADGRQVVEHAMQNIETGYNNAVHNVRTFVNGRISRFQKGIEKFEKRLLAKAPDHRPTAKTVAKHPAKRPIRGRRTTARTMA
jgi:hypothetical protein